MHEFARHRRHKADDNFLHRCEAVNLGQDPFIKYWGSISSVVEL
jgi:hypothetical protein